MKPKKATPCHAMVECNFSQDVKERQDKSTDRLMVIMAMESKETPTLAY